MRWFSDTYSKSQMKGSLFLEYCIKNKHNFKGIFISNSIDKPSEGLFKLMVTWKKELFEKELLKPEKREIKFKL